MKSPRLLSLIAILALYAALSPCRLVAAPPAAAVLPAEAKLATSCEKHLVRSFVESATAAQGHVEQIRVAIFEMGGRSRAPAIIQCEPAIAWQPVSPADIRSGALERFDVVIFPGGSGKKQGAALAQEGRRAVREFVRGGGGLVGICAGAFLTTTTHDVYLALVNAKTNVRPGAATVKVEMTESGKRTFADFPGSFVDARFAGGPIFSHATKEKLPDYVTLATYGTEFSKTESQRGTIGTPAILAAQFGKGRVVAFSFHPEVREQTQPLVKQAVLSTARDDRNR